MLNCLLNLATTFLISNTNATVKKVDIMWVIDNSGSMGKHSKSIENIRKNFDEVMEENPLEWKLGIMTTGEKERPLLGIKEKDGSVQRFTQKSHMSLIGDSLEKIKTFEGSGMETPFKVILEKLKYDREFVRNDADLDFYIFTDTDDSSNLTSKEFINKLSKIKNRKKIYFNFLITKEDEHCHSERSSLKNIKKTKYFELKKHVKVKFFNLCDEKFSEIKFEEENETKS